MSMDRDTDLRDGDLETSTGERTVSLTGELVFVSERGLKRNRE